MILEEVVARMTLATNTTLLGRAGDGSQWIYKPATGERELWDFPHGSLAIREVLTYELSESLGLGIVPETRFTGGPMGIGSAQRYVDENLEFDPLPLIQPTPNARLWPFALLDILSNNADRKLGHILAESGTGRLWAIDNGLTFHSESKLRTVLWGFAGARIPENLFESTRRFASSELEGFTARLTTLLSLEAAAAFHDRFSRLMTSPIHPDPPTDRHPLPWPLW